MKKCLSEMLQFELADPVVDNFEVFMTKMDSEKWV